MPLKRSKCARTVVSDQCWGSGCCPPPAESSAAQAATSGRRFEARTALFSGPGFAAASALLTADNELPRFNRDTKLLLGEPYNRQCDSKGTRPRLFDVVRRVPIARRFCQPADSALNFFKPKKERMIENR